MTARVESTHDLAFVGGTVVKTYRSWDRGEPGREWAGLRLLDRFAPGLAPAPLELRIDADPPAVVMERLPGRPLAGVRLDEGALDGLATALGTLHSAVPAEHLAGLPARVSGPAEMAADLRAWIREPWPEVSPSVRDALVAADAWLRGRDPDLLVEDGRHDVVFTQADGNLANFVWDGECCRIVDFEASGASDPAYELADLVEHVTVWLPGLVEAADLTDRLEYGAERRRRLLGHRRLLATFWLLMLLPGNRGHHRNPEGSVERQAARVQTLLGATA